MATTRSDICRLIVLALALGLIVAFLSLALRINTRAETLHNLSAVLNGQPISAGGERSDLPVYNRILFPAIHHLSVLVVRFLTESQWYLLLRIAAFQAAFVGFALVAYTSIARSFSVVALATALLALCTTTSFAFPYEDPSDALDILLMALGVGAALSHRFILCLALAILFAANRESAAYLGIIWVTLAFAPDRWMRRSVEGIIICVSSYAAVMLLRFLNQGPSSNTNWLTPLYNLDVLVNSLSNFNPLHWLGLLIASTALCLSTLDWTASLTRRFVLLAAAFVAPAFMFGIIYELRVFLPCFVMLAFAVAVRGQKKPDPKRHE